MFKKKRMVKDKKGQMIMIRLLQLVMTVAVLTALVPALSMFLNVMKQSDSLNCNGYIHNGNAVDPLSYNSSMNTNVLACLTFDLYIPYLLLAVLIGGITWLLARPQEQQPSYSGF